MCCFPLKMGFPFDIFNYDTVNKKKGFSMRSIFTDFWFLCET